MPLSGTGIQPNISFTPPSISFPNQQVGTTSGPQTLTLANTGTAPLTISSIAPTGTNAGDFQLINNNCITTVAPNVTCTLQVTFTPTGVGPRSASLTFTDNAPNSPQSVPLSGTGIQPNISFTPPSISFPNQQVGTTSGPQTVTLTNTGTAPLTITSIAPTGTNAGDFQLINNNCITTVAPNVTCTLQVTFTPTGVGATKCVAVASPTTRPTVRRACR